MARLLKNPKSKRAIFAILLPAYFVLTYFSYQKPNDFLPLASGILASYSMLYLSGIRLRVGMIVASLLILLNNIFIGSIGGVTTEIFVTSAHCITIWRLYNDKNAIEEPIIID